MQKRNIVPALVLSTAATVPAASALAAQHSHNAQTKPKATPLKKYKGPQIDMRWGIVHVTIWVKGKTLKNVKGWGPTERARSAFINQQALPMLRQEALQAKSADIDMVSGATMTSEAFIQSLQTALKKAHLG